ncbi:hypothetical protein K239x_34710 [Planctomycetes bacterium K23_9]|uniref:Uncharacterized protein n=1 Tax=Stieleria marina TaxID=1930275 RepID=A0A517NWG6_9BACT|nr:hypothetical protein K239x_34710 [Planctomycetes bacterium K23_9]
MAFRYFVRALSRWHIYIVASGCFGGHDAPAIGRENVCFLVADFALAFVGAARFSCVNRRLLATPIFDSILVSGVGIALDWVSR